MQLPSPFSIPASSVLLPLKIELAKGILLTKLFAFHKVIDCFLGLLKLEKAISSTEISF